MEETATLSTSDNSIEFPIAGVFINEIPVSELLETYYRAQRRTGVIE